MGLVVKVKGKNFAAGAQCGLLQVGHVRPCRHHGAVTRFVSATEVEATINIAAGAALSLFDIRVTNTNGRSGKGSDLFRVVDKRLACGASLITITPQVIELPFPAAGPACLGLSGSLDCTFGDNGLVRTLAIAEGRTLDMEALPDGKIVTLATGRPPGSTTGIDLYVLRYTANGALDTTFDGDGIRRTPLTSSLDIESAGGLAVQADGRIVVGGTYPLAKQASASRGIAVFRLNPNGAFDATFGTGGIVTLSFESTRKSSTITAFALQPDGRILVGGYTDQRHYVVRLLPDGSFDTSFDGDGRLELDGGSIGQINLQVVDGSTRLLLAGQSDACGEDDMRVMRLLNDGRLDPGFGPQGDGRVFLRLYRPFSVAGGSWAEGVAVDAGGRLIVGGETNDWTGQVTVKHIVAARLLSDGQLDVSFGGAGAVLVGLVGPPGVITEITQGPLLDSGGRIVFGGLAQHHDFTEGEFMAVRLRDDGTPDSSFGGGGVAITDLGPGSDYAFTHALQAGGRIILAGNSTTPPAIALVAYVP